MSYIRFYVATFTEKVYRDMELRAGGKTARIGLFNKSHLKIILLSGALDLILKDKEEILTKTYYDNAGVCFDGETSNYLSFQFESLKGAKFEYELF
ncbi:MAG: hypothetical protein V4506_09315 [Bacteroidota bacterium]